MSKELEHNPDNKVFRKQPDPPHKYPTAFSIWKMFKDNFGGHNPDILYYKFEQSLWVVEIDGTTHTVNG